jgi:multidrug efflux pump subunit AcrB
VSLARVAIDRPLYVWLLMLGCLLGGLWGFNALARLEDPAFTIRTAVIVTSYPGASAEEVAREVSEPLESEIQKMGEVAEIRSTNRPGTSWISVDIRDIHSAEDLPAIWTRLRNRVAEAPLPEGAGTPFVNDAFGDVYGLYYAVTAPGFSDAGVHQLATFLRRELLAVEGVADIVTSGLPQEVIVVEPDPAVAVNLGVSPGRLQSALAETGRIVDGGMLRGPDGRTLIQRPETGDGVAAISNLAIGAGGQVLSVGDFAEVSRQRVATPDLIVRHDGIEAFTLGVAGLPTADIVEVGTRVDARLAELMPDLPLGLELHPIYEQHLVVAQSSRDFLNNLGLSLAIVAGVLAVAMGWRAAVAVGGTLLLTVTGTLFFMAVFGLEMQRISLGALIIAMGMLVDNAIVVAEGMQQAMRRGLSSRTAAHKAARKTQLPLLGATVIGIMAFAGIGLSPDATGEFMFSLFAVIGISLLLSWMLAMTATPLLGHYLFREQASEQGRAYEGAAFGAYRAVLRLCLRWRWAVIAALAATTAACLLLFGQVKQQFFPFSNTPLVFVHVKLAQGASIDETERILALLDDWLAEQPDVLARTSFAGQGADRFMLTYETEDPNPSYGQIVVRTTGPDVIAGLAVRLDAFAAEALPQAEVRVRRQTFGPPSGTPVAVRFFGPDPATLRALAEMAQEVFRDSGTGLIAPRVDWREMELVLRPVYAPERAQRAGIGPDDVTEALRYAADGIQAGVYREGARQIPIVLRAPRDAAVALTDQVVWSDEGGTFVAFDQVTNGLTFQAQNTLMMRRDRVWTITVGADVAADVTAAQARASVVDAVDAIPLPPGYRMTWGGDHEASREAQMGLARQLPLSLLVMALISIVLFNGLRQPLVVWLLVPMAVCGAVLALLATGLPFTFTALLGLLSLSGMLLKNGIVMVEEIDLTRRAAPQSELDDAIAEAATSRLRPVTLAALTTILGMIPLLGDAFFQSMAVTIMGGLAFASALTLIAAPVLYRVLRPTVGSDVWKPADRRA